MAPKPHNPQSKSARGKSDWINGNWEERAQGFLGALFGSLSPPCFERCAPWELQRHR